MLPGVYAVPGWREHPQVAIRGALLAHPDGILVGGAAARASYWPGAPLDHIELAVPRKVTPQAGFLFTRQYVPPELVVQREGLRFTAPALTAVELAEPTSAESIDVALRTRMATLAGMHDALTRTANRRGNRTRLGLLIDSRDEPWSAAERRAHRLLRAAGIRGWRSNAAISLRGHVYYLDIAFQRLRLALEIDGRIHQTDPALFESDRWRQNALVLAGWRVLRFTWTVLEAHPDEFVRQVRAALA
jgi:very-short-patch-repair endonuclease